MNSQKDCEHQPRERQHILDPVTQVANTSTGGARRIFYFCDCGQLNKVTTTAFRKMA